MNKCNLHAETTAIKINPFILLIFQRQVVYPPIHSINLTVSVTK